MKKLLRLSPGAILLSFLLLITLCSFSQNRFPVTGKVTDNNGQPVEGVTVQESGTKNVAITAKDGTFTLNASSGRATLQLSSVGFESQQVQVNNQSSLTVSLRAAAGTLEDVVVIGYGTQKKRNVTGAVSSFNARNLDERPVARVDQALVGQLAGVTVKQTTGVPGRAFSVQVRGSGSITGGNEPLYVIDGFPLTLNASNQGNGNFSTGNPLDNINPNDIESIDVLKDAAAAAIYGSRASNGVVLITTKRGRTGRPVIDVNVYAGYNGPAKKLQMMNGEQWIENATEVINATYVAMYGAQGATAADDRAIRLARIGSFNANFILDPRWSQPGYPGLRFIDWQDVITRKGGIQNYQVSASGGTDAVRYFMSGNFAQTQGFVKYVGYKAYSLRANLEVAATKNLKFGLNVTPTYSVTQDPGVEGQNSIFHQALGFTPVQEDTMGLLPNIGNNGQYVYSNTPNSPLGRLMYNEGTTKRYRTIGTLYGEYQIIKGLNWRSSINLDNTDNIATTYVPYITAGAQANRIFNGTNNLLASTSGTYNSYRRQTFVTEHTLTYNTAFKRDHSLSVLGGYAYNLDRLDRVTMSSNGGFTSAVIKTLSAAAAVTGNTTSTQNVLISFFSRVNYGFKNKYFLTASVREDGSSRFGINNQFGFFPAASLKWVLSEENFMNAIPAFSNLQLRVSYGVNGNHNLPNDYSSIATIGSAGYVFGTSAAIGQAPNVLANPSLKWERSQTYDVGVDFGFFRNRLTGSFDYYSKLNTDLLLNAPVPAATGFITYLTNIGEVRNIGQELELTSRNLVGKVQWTTSVNVTHNTNRIKALGPDQDQIIIPNTNNQGSQILRVGKPLYSIYALQTIGFLTAADIARGVARYGTGQQEGDLRYQDFNNDGVITEADKQIVGHPSPDFIYGVTNTVRYKGFDLNVLVQGQFGGYIYSEIGRALTRPGQGRSDNHPVSFINRWRSPSDPGEGRFGKTYATYYTPITAATDWLYSSDYLRVRNITLGYNLKTVFRTAFVQGARVYVTLENFFGYDRYTNGLNPDAANTSASSNSAFPTAGDYGGLPLARSMVLGLNFTF